MMLVLRNALLFFVLLLCAPAMAQQAAPVIIPARARFIQTDELGNVYIIRSDNTLTRYTEHGDSSAFYRSLNNGDIGAVDATNPLEVLVYFPKYSRIVVLDRMMTPKSEINLQRLNLFSPPAIAKSADGSIWVYDPFNARLRKVTETTTELSQDNQSNDLRQQAGFVPQVVYMQERDRRLYVCDTANGILIFDRYANYLNVLPITGIRELQISGPQIIFQRGDSLISYHTLNFSERAIPLPSGVFQATYNHGNLYLRMADRIEISRLEP